MPIFRCDACGCIENTALCNYWCRPSRGRPLCSVCDPVIGTWHGDFARRPAAGMLLGNDGFLYSEENLRTGQLAFRIENQAFRIIGVLQPDGTTEPLPEHRPTGEQKERIAAGRCPRCNHPHRKRPAYVKCLTAGETAPASHILMIEVDKQRGW